MLHICRQKLHKCHFVTLPKIKDQTFTKKSIIFITMKIWNCKKKVDKKSWALSDRFKIIFLKLVENQHFDKVLKIENNLLFFNGTSHKYVFVKIQFEYSKNGMEIKIVSLLSILYWWKYWTFQNVCNFFFVYLWSRIKRRF